jgi:hypothetical protein
VGPRADLDISEERQISFICQESNRDSPVGQPIAQSLRCLKYRGSPDAFTRKTKNCVCVA